MQSLSLKKLGKRPELHEVDGALDLSRTNRHPQSPGTVRQKRVLPSRSRRGGPGVGSCSVDMMIIDTERRARDGKPVIPPTQPFFLTTHSKAVPPPPEASAPDGEAAGSYFDQPEVKAAYLAQRAIQVPEFSPLPDDAVGGRLRARAEEEGPETSDLAYINRHRKYETFEKRQRRREKEKLVHEQYKLKERIEQLKGMDASAFGAGGEARRKEMLDIAEGLEMRYAVLLPPEPKRMKKIGIKRGRSEGAQAGTTTGDDADADTEYEATDHPVREVDRPTSAGPRPQQVNRATARLALHPNTVSRSLAVSVALAANEPSVTQHLYNSPTTSATTSSRTGYRGRDTGRFLVRAKSEERQTPTVEQSTPEVSSVRGADAASAPPPRKRQRVDSQPKRHQTPDEAPVTTSLLLQIAARKAAQPQARQTSRTTTAFGHRVPFEVEGNLDTYKLPEWLITLEELEHIRETQARSATRSASPRVLNGVEKHTTVVPVVQAVHQEPNGTTDAMDVDQTHGPALPTSLREESAKEQEGESNPCS
ncbi:hypothetical protein JB92DRAFT_3110190 [Gautieria morchelliformis]|nr:hypothetical protein JB92DRAFT_3110190 [Gautieria morchelliformis]